MEMSSEVTILSMAQLMGNVNISDYDTPIMFVLFRVFHKDTTIWVNNAKADLKNAWIQHPIGGKWGKKIASNNDAHMQIQVSIPK